MNLTEYRDSLRVDLKDPGGEDTIWTDDELNRSIYRAMSDLSRFLPQEKVYEVTLKFTITDEAWVAAAAAGTWVTLGNKPIKYESETVKNAAGTVCVRDTDYYLDYTSGKITHITASSIADDEACTISYTKSRLGIDTSSLTDMIRVSRVEYPVGDVPQSFVSYNLDGKLLYIKGSTDSQSLLVDGKHIAIYYKATHIEPELTVDSSCPSFLHNTVLLAASAYALFIRALHYEQQAGADIVLSETELTEEEHDITPITDALDKVDTYATGAATPSIKKYLTTGESKINTVNKGDDVPENYALYAGRSGDIASLFINEAAQRNAIQTHYVSRSTNYVQSTVQLLALAALIREEAIDRRNEAWSIWRDKKEYAGDFTLTAGRQPTR